MQLVLTYVFMYCISINRTLPWLDWINNGLIQVDLSFNHFLPGVLPPRDVQYFLAIEQLILQDVNLVGPIPTEIGTLTTLELLYLNDNIKLVGTVPSEVGLLTKLRALNINNTQLQGTLPNTLCIWASQGKINITVDCGMIDCGCLNGNVTR